MNRNMMQQLQKMQQEMAKAQDEIQNATVEGAAAGGAVKVTMSGDFKVTKIALDKSVVDPDDVETLEDVIVAALNDARA
ncbi:MAG TPA: YbaB/EbfC family nucleoid-associated protein, partial [Candidatus Limnocylindrales bacterium]|nr:YbaB/EbfC family nucleoid-associated protein [Candidatus Limnocylindrales bacterium]